VGAAGAGALRFSPIGIWSILAGVALVMLAFKARKFGKVSHRRAAAG
jgi:hypothetical protein